MDDRTMPRTIYLVTEGAYSDYHVITAFETEQLARDYCARLNRRDRARGRLSRDTYDVEPRHLWAAPPPDFLLLSLSAYVDKTGVWEHAGRNRPRGPRERVEATNGGLANPAPVTQEVRRAGDGTFVTVSGSDHDAVRATFKQLCGSRCSGTTCRLWWTERLMPEHDYYEPWQPQVGQRVRVRLSGECQMPIPPDSLTGRETGIVRGHVPTENGQVGTVAEVWPREPHGHRYEIRLDGPVPIGNCPYTGPRWIAYAALELEPIDA